MYRKVFALFAFLLAFTLAKHTTSAPAIPTARGPALPPAMLVDLGPHDGGPAGGATIANVALSFYNTANWSASITNGDYTVGQVYTVAGDNLVAWGADVLWPATTTDTPSVPSGTSSGPFTVQLWDQGSALVAGQALHVPAPFVTSVVRVVFDVPVNLVPGRSYVLAVNDDNHAHAYMALGTQPISGDIVVAQGLLYPDGNGRSAYVTPSGGMPVANALALKVAMTLLTTNKSTLTSPYHGQSNVDLYQAFTWKVVPQATSYRLKVGTASGAADVYDSAEMFATGAASGARLARHVPTLLTSTTYYAKVSTKINGVFVDADDVVFTTSSADSGVPMSAYVRDVQSYTDQVRQMADPYNNAHPGTPLYDHVVQAGHNPVGGVSCFDYAETLVDLLTAAHVRKVKRQDIAFQSLGGLNDVHTVAVGLDSDAAYKVFDPTFSLSAYYAPTGQLATAAQIQTAARAKNWSQINIRFLGVLGPAVAKSYYLDYMLLYLDVPADQSPQYSLSGYITDLGVSSTTAPSAVTPYLSSGGAYYLANDCTPGALVVTIAGSPSTTVTSCNANRHSQIFLVPAGNSVSVDSGHLATPNRYVY